MNEVDKAMDSVEQHDLYGQREVPIAHARVLAAEVRRLRAERDKLRAAAKRLSEERQSGLASLDAWVQLRAALSCTEGGEK